MSYINPKQSFVLYRNMRKHMAKLPRKQQGTLLMAFMDYADYSAEGHTDATPFCKLSGHVFGYPHGVFLHCIRHSHGHGKWNQKQQNYLEAARKWQKGKDAANAKEASADAMRKYVQNLPLAGRQT